MAAEKVRGWIKGALEHDHIFLATEFVLYKISGKDLKTFLRCLKKYFDDRTKS